MEIIFDWLRAHTDILGFTVASIIFLITILLVVKRLIGFSITLLFLLFSILAGLVVSNQGFIKEWALKDTVRETPALKQIQEPLQEEVQVDTEEPTEESAATSEDTSE